jgi:hypothetical protein
VAENLDRGPARPEADEQIDLVRWTQADLESRLDEIEDAKTLVGLLMFREEQAGATR